MLSRSFKFNAARGAFGLSNKATSKAVAPLHTATTPVDLHFTSQVPFGSDNKTAGAIVILHGLFGSARNWGAHSRTFARNLNRPVYALDLRNHGASTHAEPMTYSAMAADVIHFIRKHSLSDVALIGHSMGGKVAMSVALDSALPASTLANLVVVDIAPARGQLSDEFKGYIEAMKKIEAAKVSNRKEALEILQEYEKNLDVCTFLLTNLVQQPNASHFRIPVDLIGDAIHEMGSFPFTEGETQWDGKTMFVKGSRSKFINRHNVEIAEKLFPNMKMETLDTDHWGMCFLGEGASQANWRVVHSEKPHEFSKLVEDFVRPL
ncbi:alpha/beta-hydrolase [Mycena rosella]|uniref:Alpha/beta-hydrolase n=1 Tax=Mycena rosella TaxID=1033263 RepID=A0AAD7GHU8_MYCRO|nr:alpha/beta-hydrolase [Mycena rosella]